MEEQVERKLMRNVPGMVRAIRDHSSNGADGSSAAGCSGVIVVDGDLSLLRGNRVGDGEECVHDNEDECSLQRMTC